MNKVYEYVTERIVKMLDEGTVPWHKPWTCYGTDEDSLPANLKSKRPYRGVNLWLLPRIYSERWFLSVKQCNDFGGKIKKGEHGWMVVFWKMLDRENDETGKVERIPMLRYYTVFNVEQCELPDGVVPKPPKRKGLTKAKKLAACEKLIKGFVGKPKVSHHGDRAYYSPSLDVIGMPTREQFKSPEMYYTTLFHELTHSTGHESRLGRSMDSFFYTTSYSQEELVAEMGAAFLCGFAGVEGTFQHNANYIAHWKKHMLSEPKCVTIAAARAQKAVDFIRGIKYENSEPNGNADKAE